MKKIKIHKEGKVIIIANLILWLIVSVAVWLWSDSITTKVTMTLISLFFAIFMLYFFRVPERMANIDEDLVMSPGDGKVVIVKEVEENEFFQGPCKQISVFLSFFNVHITWYPVSGTVSYYKYHPGKYLFAFLPKSSLKNERTTIGVRTQNGKEIMFRQIAGIVARRIVCYAEEGISAEQASEAGFIKFGSRLDVFVPLDTEILVKKGDKVRGTTTALAKLK